MPTEQLNSLNEVSKNTSLIVIIFGFIGAFLNYTRRGKRTKRQIIASFLTDLASSVMLSLVTFYSVSGFTNNELLAVGVSGFVAHQGTRAVYWIELYFAKKIGIDTPNDINSKKE